MRDSPTRAALAVTATSSSGRRCLSATIAVISFVMLAIGSCTCASEDASTVPVDAFTTVYARASTSGGAARAAPANASETMRTSNPRPIGREGYFTRIRSPTRSAVGLRRGLRRSRRATLECVFEAIAEKLSPRWMTYLRVIAAALFACGWTVTVGTGGGGAEAGRWSP